MQLLLSENMKRLVTICFFLCCVLPVFSQCGIATIEVDEPSACAPKIIQFTLKNAPNAVSYIWNTGKGNISGTDTNFTYYDKPQVVNATVQLTLSNGSKCSISKANAVTIHSKPNPQFAISRNTLCYGADTITLYDKTPNSFERTWIVDGTSYTNADAETVHRFVSIGKKSISLIVTDSNGCQGIGQFSDVVDVYSDLNFDFTADRTSGCVPLNVNYRITSNPKSNFQKSFSWEIDGVSNKYQFVDSPSLAIYTKPGQYSTKLKVSLSNGCNYVKNKIDYIKAGESVLFKLELEDTVFCIRDTIKLKQTNLLPDGTTTWILSGTTDSFQNATNSSSFIVPQDVGYLSVKLIHNYNNCIAQRNYTDTIRVRGIRSDFKSDDRYHCEIPHTVHLENLTNELDAQNVAYKWLIKQKDVVKYTSTNYNDSFTFYTLPAFYDVSLIAEGDNGCSDTFTRFDYIYQDSLNNNFDVIPKIGCVNQEIKFNNSTKPSSYLSGDVFEWYFKGLDRTTNLDSAYTRNATTSYSDTGYYDAVLIGKNGLNCRDTLRLDSIVRIIIPILDFEVDKDIICLGDTFNFKGLSKPKEAEFVHNWIIKNLDSNLVESFDGETLAYEPELPGEYELTYYHEIEGGCLAYDTISLYVNGVQIDIQLDTIAGCAPLQVNASPSIIYNFNFGSTDDSIFYTWKIAPTNGSVLSDEYTSQPNAILYENQNYMFNGNFANRAGCRSKANSEEIVVGARANFNIKDSDLCFGDSLVVTDLSDARSSILRWDINPKEGSIERYLGQNVYSFYIPKDGEFILTQIVQLDNSCYDTLAKPFKVAEVLASFESSDSLLVCAPVFAEFNSTSKNADSLFWDFGDGDTGLTVSKTAGHIYNKNSGWTKGYDIKLVAKSIYGCLDTAIKENYIVVKGPVPNFEPIRVSGCEPLEITFLDLSKHMVSSIWNFSDGTSLIYSDTSKAIVKHTFYTQQDSNFSYFTVELIGYDSLGCAASFTMPDSIAVTTSPEIDYHASATRNYCVPFDITLEDRGIDIVSRVWTLDTLATFADSIKQITLLNYGNYIGQLVVQNKYDCADTLDFTIVAKENPIVNFADNDSICKNRTAMLYGEVSNYDSISFVAWNFGEPSNPRNAVDSNINGAITYLNRGLKNVQFKAQLLNGCKDSISKQLYVSDENDIEQADIQYISFSNNNQLDVAFNPATYHKFKSYQWRKTGLTWQNVFDRDSTYLQDYFATLPYDSLCYDFAIADYCDFVGEKANQHCFIYLKIESNQAYTNQLSWSPYVGWPSVKSYSVFRADPASDFEKIAEVSGDILSYLDSNLCDIEYTYYVQANHPAAVYTSKSFQVRQKPLYVYNTVGSSIQNVTVLPPDQIKVIWPQSQFNYFKNYVLTKYNTLDNSVLDQIELLDTTYIDTAVYPDFESYRYLIKEKDKCDYLNTTDREGQSILLKGYYANESATINESRIWWSKYKNWQDGVANYNVLLFDVPKTRLLGTLNPNDTFFIDPDYHPQIKGHYCYQVYATNSHGDTSYSNIICLHGKERVLIPTAFSPNKDGLNDVFKPVTQFVKQESLSDIAAYTFAVYNRWGEKMFETNDLDSGWNGRFMGKQCQQGGYFYTMSIKNLENMVMNYSGTVTLLW